MRLPPDAFQRIVDQALGELPAEIFEVIDNATLVVEEWPTQEQLDDQNVRDRYGILGLYEGVPLVNRDHYTMVLPDKITLFHRPLEAMCTSIEELIEQVKITIVHEIAHHLGWSETEIRNAPWAMHQSANRGEPG